MWRRLEDSWPIYAAELHLKPSDLWELSLHEVIVMHDHLERVAAASAKAAG